MDREHRWIELARLGDRDAFVRLVEAYQGPVYNLAYRLLGGAAAAEGAAQETFLRAFRRLGSYDPARKFSPWLLTITSHYCIDRLRRRRLVWFSFQDERTLPAALASSQPGPEQRTIQREREAEVQALVATLPADYRAVVVLRYWYSMSYEEIAQTTGSTVSAVKSRLFRAWRTLVGQMQRAENGIDALAPGAAGRCNAGSLMEAGYKFQTCHYQSQSPAQSPSFVTPWVTTGHPASCYDVVVIEITAMEKRWTMYRDTQNQKRRCERND